MSLLATVSANQQASFNPRRWGFFISGYTAGAWVYQYVEVSIPVDGAFLFQEWGSLSLSVREGRGFNPRRWGFFISGLTLQHASGSRLGGFNPRRWGFFISGGQ